MRFAALPVTRSFIAACCVVSLAGCGQNDGPTIEGVAAPTGNIRIDSSVVFVGDTVTTTLRVRENGADITDAVLAERFSITSVSPNILVTRTGPSTLRIVGLTDGPALIVVQLRGEMKTYLMLSVAIDPVDVALSFGSTATIRVIEGDTARVILSGAFRGAAFDTTTVKGLAVTSTADSVMIVRRAGADTVFAQAGVFGTAALRVMYKNVPHLRTIVVGIDSLSTARFIGAPSGMILGDSTTVTSSVRTVAGRAGKATRFVYSTSDSTVLTISASGNIKAIRSGVATIRIRAAEPRFAVTGFGSAATISVTNPNR